MSLENPLWHYALTLYAEPGVEQSCLQLQDQGAVINRLLLACWLGGGGISLNSVRLQQLDGDWHNGVTLPVRAVRYRVRELLASEPTGEDCYRALRQAEMAAEQVELMLLWQQSHHWQPDVSADADLIRHNLEQVVGDLRLSQVGQASLFQLQSAAMQLIANH